MSAGARVASNRPSLRQGLDALRFVPALFRQVWRTSRTLIVATVLVRAARAILPVLILYVAKLTIDEVVLQTTLPSPGARPSRHGSKVVGSRASVDCSCWNLRSRSDLTCSAGWVR